ncbi:hypothetical protein FOLKNPGA_01711 [Legionella sp. PC1000]|uniref:hypothetical protein n=1 Tax=Legionella sp. PC1000 TaxID=2746060 RepID=UPI0015FBB9DC|nr:hypothetical protein [Legionella sp. PC1000]QLZ68931.1 hypothetical protein FOLKNPGA_01711 [Legionella sp. PC1000]
MLEINGSISSVERIPISDEELTFLKKVNEIVDSAISFEKNFEAIIHNFINYELTLSHISIEQRESKMFLIHNYLSELNEKLMSLLSLFTVYWNESEKLAPDQFKNLFDYQLSNSTSFNLIENLRKFSLHKKKPLSILVFGMNCLHKKENLNSLIDKHVSKSTFGGETNSSLPSEADIYHLTFCLKQYIESLYLVHKTISNSIESTINKIKDKLQQFLFKKNIIATQNQGNIIVFVYKKEELESYCFNFGEYNDLNTKHASLTNFINTSSPTEKEMIHTVNKPPSEDNQKEGLESNQLFDDDKSLIKCPNCDHIRKENELTPDWQCPSCKIAYNKYPGFQFKFSNLNSSTNPSDEQVEASKLKKKPNKNIQFFEETPGWINLLILIISIAVIVASGFYLVQKISPVQVQYFWERYILSENKIDDVVNINSRKINTLELLNKISFTQSRF